MWCILRATLHAIVAPGVFEAFEILIGSFGLLIKPREA